MKALHNIAYEIGQLFFPKVCIGCNSVLHANENLMCVICQNALPLTGAYFSNNELEKIFKGRFTYQFCTALLYFRIGGITQQLLHGLKYQNNTQIATYLGHQMALHLATVTINYNNAIIIPVPLAAKKMHQRGFNQSELIGQALATTLQIPYSNNNLLRKKNTDSQTRKSRLERLDNMKDAFEIINATQLQGKHILLLDDVVTTGATIEACALHLLKIPNISISIISAAIVFN
jgi:competence protein ComFC